MASTKKVKCPVCGESFELDQDLAVGDMTYCVDCDQELRVLSLVPPKVKKIVDYPEVCDANKKRTIPASIAGDEDEGFAAEFENDDSDETEEYDAYDASVDDDEEPEAKEPLDDADDAYRDVE